MSQEFGAFRNSTETGPEYSAEDYATDVDQSLEALLSLNAGTVAPSYAVEGTLWLDTSAAIRRLRVFDGFVWPTLCRIDPSTGLLRGGDGHFIAGTVSNTTVASATLTTLLFAETLDPDGAYNPATGIFTAPSTGFYLFTAGAQVPDHPSGTTYRAYIDLYDGTNRRARGDLSNDRFATQLSVSALLYLSAADQIRVRLYHEAGSTLTLSGVFDGGLFRFSGARIG